MELGHLLTPSGLTYPEDSSKESFKLHHHHHHHHISVMELGHLLTRSSVTYPEVSSKVCHDPSASWRIAFHYPAQSITNFLITFVIIYNHIGVFGEYSVTASSKYDVTTAATSYAGPKLNKNLKCQCVIQNENRVTVQVLHKNC
jgi:hypothetical protein